MFRNCKAEILIHEFEVLISRDPRRENYAEDNCISTRFCYVIKDGDTHTFDIKRVEGTN